MTAAHEGAPAPGWPLAMVLADEAATAQLAEDVAMQLGPGDAVALAGGLGAGKTSFARALIRALADNPDLEVPSPTFTLMQEYLTPRLTVAHFDLYRLSGPEQLDEIGFDEALATGAVLVEWPDRASGRMPRDALTVELAVAAGGGRTALLTGRGTWPARLARTRTVRAFLEGAGWTEAARRHLKGDASSRRFEQVRRQGASAVLMDWPRQPESPPIRGGRSWEAIAHRARDVRPVVAVGEALRAAGLSAPQVLAADYAAGLVLQEDFGGETVLAGDLPDPQRYRAAVEVLAAIHAAPRPRQLSLPDGSVHVLPDFDRDAFAIEVSLLPSWYVPHQTGKPVAKEAVAAFEAIWDGLIGRLVAAEKSWVLLDFHSPNLFWLAERQGIRRIGLIDYQDAQIGPAAYDLASLMHDARAPVSPELETMLLDHYLGLRRGPAFDETGFREALALAMAERATKVLGIFARLARRDGKTGYLTRMPLIQAYLARALRHPVLRPLAAWYGEHLPGGIG